MNKEVVIDHLIAARKLIENEDDWCQHHYVVRKENADKRRCMIQALVEQMPPELQFISEADTTEYKLLRMAGGLGKNHYLSQYNDTHSHAEVLALFDKAIELAKHEA
jgi:hypothetical protein